MTSDFSRAAVCAPVAPLFAEPKVASAQISQYLAGRELDIIEQRDDWLHIAGPDEYEGWMHRGYVVPAPADAAHRSAPDRISLGCVTTTAVGMRRAMPLGAWLAPEEKVRSGDVVSAAQRLTQFPPEALAITRSAQSYF